MSKQDDNREFTRVPLPFPVRVTAGQTVIETGDGLDVSAGGVSIATDVRLPEGTPCKLEILLAQSMAIEASCVIVRAHPGGLALKIEEIGLSSFDLLKNLVRFNAEKPGVIEKEFEEHLGLCKR